MSKNVTPEKEDVINVTVPRLDTEHFEVVSTRHKTILKHGLFTACFVILVLFTVGAHILLTFTQGQYPFTNVAFAVVYAVYLLLYIFHWAGGKPGSDRIVTLAHKENEFVVVSELKEIPNVAPESGSKPEEIIQETDKTEYTDVLKTFPQTAKLIEDFYLTKGFEIRCTKQLLSSMFYSHSFIALGNTSDFNNLSMFSELIASKTFNIEQDSYENSLYENDTFKDAIKYAKVRRDKPVFILVRNIKPTDVKNYLHSVWNYVLNPFDEYSGYTSNIWIVLCMDKNSEIKKVDFDYLKFISVLNLDFIPSPKSNEKAPLVKFSIVHIKQLLTTEKDTKFYPEQEWRKLDDLIAYVNKEHFYQVDNRVLVKIEDYISTYCQIDDLKDDALDEVLAYSLLLDMIGSSKDPYVFKAQFNIVEELNRIYGEDKLEKTKKIVKDYLADFLESKEVSEDE